MESRLYVLVFFIFIFLLFVNYCIENEHDKSDDITKNEVNNNNYLTDSLRLVYKLEVIPELSSNLHYSYNKWSIFAIKK
ncbi:MAG: hypothetical protein P1P88_06930 [Bacteroidales bacterium]|nr:hypothetical protein [Bacteroidales bacterium]